MAILGRLRSWFASPKRAHVGQPVIERQAPAPPPVPQVTTRHPDAEAFFLSRFLVPNDITGVLSDTRWSSVLSEAPAETLTRVRAAGLLEPASLLERLGGLSARELKDQCRAAGLKVSGRKEELAERVAVSDPTKAEALVAGRTVLRLTEAGTVIAREFTDRRDAARAKAEAQFREFFSAGRFREAVAAVAGFEASAVFSRGLGMNWRQHEGEGDAAALEQIAHRWPGLIEWVSTEVRSEFRAPAAEQYIWGRSRPLSRPPEVEGPLSTEVVLNMLAAFGTIAGQLETYRRAGAPRIEILASDDSCGACKRAARVYRLSQVPEIPVRGCTGELGCLCSISPSFD